MRDNTARDLSWCGAWFQPLSILMVTLVVLCGAWGCGGSGQTEKTPGEEKVGDMSDRSYFGGQMLFIKTGYMSGDEIKKVLRERVTDWKFWKSSGRKAEWMHP